MGLIRRARPVAPRPPGRFRIRRPALTASAVSVGVQDRRDANANHAPVGNHQSKIERALRMYDEEGACWYPAQFYRRSMERIRYYPAVLNEHGEPEESDDPALVELFQRMRDPGGTSIRQLASNYGRLRFLIGDGLLIVSELDGEEAWEYLSPVELQRNRNTSPQQWTRDDGIEKTTLTEASDLDAISGTTVRIWRLWARHPSKSGFSDSPVLPQLSKFETLTSLNLAMSAEALSRAANRGLLFIPDELTIETLGDDEQGVDDDPEADPFLREFIEGLQRGVQNPGSVDAMAPFILRGPGVLETIDGKTVPMADAIKWMALGPQDRYLESDAADKVIEQIALGLDMPKEMVTGTGDVNHWGGWLLDEQGFRQHVAPVVEEFCDDLGTVYLRPEAIASGVPNADRVVVWYDPVDAIAHPDEFPMAKDGVELGAVGLKYLRDKMGAGDEDAPTDEDLAILFGLKGKTPPGQDVGETAPQDGGTGADANEAPPDQQDAQPESVVAAMILGAAELQVKAARKAAGARLVQRSKRCDECQEAIRDVPHGMVAAALGHERIREIIDGHTSESALVAGAGALLAAQAREWGVAEKAAAELGEMVEAHALRTLCEREAPPLPAGFAAAALRAAA